MTTPSDRNLLFGIIALQMDFIRREQLVAGTSTWLTDKSRQLEEILVEQGALTEQDRQLLAPLVARHLQNHDGDPRQSLAALSSIGSVADELRSLDDQQIEATLSLVSTNPAIASLEATQVHSSDPTSPKSPLTREVSENRFRVLRSHAKGGLGEVFVAQDTELNREVALKEIQDRFADDEASRSRFLLEAEVTGGLEHPGIVPVYGLGQYDDGRPFYAMRFIKGDSLQEAADHFHRRRPASAPAVTSEHTSPATGVKASRTDSDYSSLEFRKLLGRFIDVCQAIEYAHSRGVLHRDLKPGNIMLGKYGETLVVDWGLAKAQGREEGHKLAGEATLRPASASGSAPTMMGSAIGTPAFMPPEQAAGDLDRLGPPSDVYSLGATLYYLLTGKPPFQGQNLTQILERVRNGDYAPPRKLAPDVPKPLEAVCLRAMATDPKSRYDSPRDLAEDIERFLADERVAAYQEPFSVRARRWMRQHPRTIAALAATLLVGLISSIVIAGVVSQNAEIVARQNEQLKLASEAERQSKEDALAVIEFFTTNVLARARPKNQEGGLGIDATIREAIDVAVPYVDASFRDRPLVEASIRKTLGGTYFYLGEYELAIGQLERSHKLLVKEQGPESRDTLIAANALAEAYAQNGQFQQAFSLFDSTLQTSRKVLPQDDPFIVTVLAKQATWIFQSGRIAQALPLLDQAVQAMARQLGSQANETLTMRSVLARCLLEAGEYPRGAELAEAVVESMQVHLGADHPQTWTAMSNLAQAYQSIEELDKSIALNESVLQLRKDNLGPEHPETLSTMNNLALAYQVADQSEQAIELIREAVQIAEVKLQPEHPETILFKCNLATVMRAMGRIEQAFTLARENLEVVRNAKEVSPRATITALRELAASYEQVGRPVEALEPLNEALELTQDTLGTGHELTLECMGHLANSHGAAGRFGEAIRILTKTLALCKTSQNPDAALQYNLLVNLAYQHQNLQQFDEAEQAALEAAESARASLGANHPQTLNAMDTLATIYQNTGRLDEALPLFQETLQRRQQQLGPDHEASLSSENNLGVCYWHLGQLDKSIPLFRRLAEARAKKHGKLHPAALQTQANLGVNYCDQGDFENGLILLQEVHAERKRHAALRWATESLLHYTIKAKRTDAAVRLVQEVLADARETLPAGSPQLAAELASYGFHLLQLNAWNDAELTLRESLAIREKTMPEHWLTFNTQTMLGACLSCQEKFPAAEAMLLSGYRGLQQQATQIPPRYQDRVGEALQWLVQLYTDWEKPEQVDKWKLEWESWQARAEK